MASLRVRFQRICMNIVVKCRAQRGNTHLISILYWKWNTGSKFCDINNANASRNNTSSSQAVSSQVMSKTCIFIPLDVSKNRGASRDVSMDIGGKSRNYYLTWHYFVNIPHIEIVMKGSVLNVLEWELTRTDYWFFSPIHKLMWFD